VRNLPRLAGLQLAEDPARGVSTTSASKRADLKSAEGAEAIGGIDLAVRAIDLAGRDWIHWRIRMAP